MGGKDEKARNQIILFTSEIRQTAWRRVRNEHLFEISSQRILHCSGTDEKQSPFVG